MRKLLIAMLSLFMVALALPLQAPASENEVIEGLD